jgi:hypothetical protein
MSAGVGGATPFRPNPTYTTRRDVTALASLASSPGAHEDAGSSPERVQLSEAVSNCPTG